MMHRLKGKIYKTSTLMPLAIFIIQTIQNVRYYGLLDLTRVHMDMGPCMEVRQKKVVNAAAQPMQPLQKYDEKGQKVI